MNVHNLKRGDRAFSLSLRRVVKVTRVLEKHHFYEVEAVDRELTGAESECWELVPIDDTPEGRKNKKIVEKIETLYREIAGLTGKLR
jgi:hypothetical protein